MNEMNTNEIAELLLAALYDETETLGHSNFFLSIDEIAVNVGLEDRAAVVEASRLLEDKGYILLAFDHASALSAFITPSGEAFAMQGGETGIIGEYQRFRSLTGNKVPGAIESGLPSDMPPLSFQSPPLTQSDQPVPHHEGITHIIASMEMLVRNDPSLDGSVKEDLVVDIRTLELQMSRKTANKPLVDLIIAGLKEVSALSPLIDLLISMK